MADNESQRIMNKNENNMDSSNTSSRIPKLRFPEFTGEWEEKFVKDICDINTGKSNTQDQVPNGLYPFYIRSATPVRSNRYLYDCEAVITIGDGQIGKVFHYVNGKFDLHQRCYMMSNFMGVDSRYFYHFFSQYFYDRAMRLTAKATVDSVRLEMISEMPIILPPTLAEQQKIAECLSELDNLITARGQKVDALKEKKKGLMQQLFPRQGETLPRLRFTGFTGEWELLELGQVCSVNRGVRVTRKDLDKEGKYPVFQNTNSPMGYFDLFNVTANNPFVIIGGSAGTMGFCKTNFWAADDCAYFGENELLEKYFLYVTLLTHELEIQNSVRGGNIPRIDRRSIEKIKIALPALSEQQKIAECLSALDETIAAEAEKLEALKNHKKGLMQQLFPQPAK